MKYVQASNLYTCTTKKNERTQTWEHEDTEFEQNIALSAHVWVGNIPVHHGRNQMPTSAAGTYFI